MVKNCSNVIQIVQLSLRLSGWLLEITNNIVGRVQHCKSSKNVSRLESNSTL